MSMLGQVKFRFFLSKVMENDKDTIVFGKIKAFAMTRPFRKGLFSHCD